MPTATGPSPRGQVDAEGRFVLGTYASEDGAPAGDYRVIVVQAIAPDAARHLRHLGEEHAGHTGGVEVVALKHASPETTGIQVEVTPAPQNELSIVVEAR